MFLGACFSIRAEEREEGKGSEGHSKQFYR
jgi:hypothetical protein